jgi:outer membrane protein assembly factor BamB
MLCGVKTPITSDIMRRIHTVSMAYGEGILVVPTQAGAILGVDLLTQSLVWSYSYREGNNNQAAPPPNPWQPQPRQPTPDANSDFKDSPPVIARGKVVFAAADGASIHCVDLRDGIGVWHVGRSDDLYLGGVHNNKVLMVGKSRTRALSLDTGKVVWDVETGTPCGQGVASKGLYFLPVRNRDKQGEVCVIDIEKGMIRAHNRMRKVGALPPGNLIFHDGCLLSQSATHVTAFPQMDVRYKEIAELLKKHIDDEQTPTLLTERGELYLADGKVHLAVDDLRTALSKKPDKKTLPKTRLKLYEAFTELFQSDFPKVADKYLNEYKEVCKAEDDPETNRRTARFLYLVGRGREEQGRLVDAYQAYVDFAALPLNKDKISDPEDSYHKTQPTVWVKGRVAAMIANATAAQRKPLENKIAKEWNAIQSKNDMDAIRRFVNTFDVAFPVGRQARLRLADVIMEKHDKSAFLEAELALLQLKVADLAKDPETQARALEALARLEIRKGTEDSMRLAARYYRDLGERFPKTVVRDDQTGADFFNSLATDKRFLPYLGADDQLKITGRMTYKAGAPSAIGVDTNANFNLQNAFTFSPAGKVGPFFKKHRLLFSLNSRELIWVDGNSNKEVAKLNPANMTQYQYYNYLSNWSQNHLFPNARYRFYQTKGHLAVLQIGPMVFGLDLVNHKILWDRNMMDNTPLVNMNYNINPNTWDGTLEMQSWDRFTGQPFTRKIGMLGNLEANYVSIQTQNGLVVLDPIKGTELWTKTDIPPRTQIFGDSKHIFMVEVRDGKAVGGAKCLRASDGVAVKDVPDFSGVYNSRLRIIDGKLLLSEVKGGKKVLRLYDVLTGKDDWKRTFNSKALPVRCENDDFAGMIEPDGKVLIVNAKTNKEVLQARLDVDHLKDVNDPMLLDDDDQFYLALNKPLGQGVAGGYLYTNFGSGIRCSMANGMFYAFHRKNGKLNWTHDVEHQMVVMDQFRNNPLVIFTSRYYQNQGNWIWMVATKSLEKRTGRRVYDPDPKNFNNGFQYYALNIDAKKGTVDLVGSFDAVRHYVTKDKKKRAKDKGGAEKKGDPKQKNPAGGPPGAGDKPPPPPPPAVEVPPPVIRKIKE